MSALVDSAARTDESTYRRLTPTLIEIIGRSIWRLLEREGRRRATRELLASAARHEPFDPELARRLREASRFDTTT